MRLGIALLIGTLSAPCAWAAGDPVQGQRLAELWCSSCHVVDRAERATDMAPSFSSIAARRHDDQAWLKAWLVSPHPPMPQLNLSRAEIDNITAYLGSLSH